MTQAVTRPHPGKAAGSGPRPWPGFHWLEAGVIALITQTVLIHGGILTPSHGAVFPVAILCSHLLLVPFLLRNFSFWGIRLLAGGLALNLAVMLANGGLMPVEHDAVAAVGRNEIKSLEEGAWIPGSKNVLLDAKEIKLDWLSDTLLLPLPSPFTKAVSPGDLLVLAGALVAYAEVVRRTSAWRRSEAGT